MKNFLILILLAALAGLIFSGCSNPNSNAPETGAVHGREFVSPTHSSQFHGEQVKETGAESCQICHGTNLVGSATVASCTECHFEPGGGRIPPGTSWIHGSIPHSQLEDFGSVCIACHSANRAAGNGPEPCHDCHDNHPLGQAWLDRTQVVYHGDSDLNCALCHDLENDCNECHFGPSGSKVPDGVAWQHGTIPHEESGLTESNAVCSQCHELTRSYGTGPKNCHDCHTHAIGQPWLDKNQQDFHGTSTLECGSCHNLNTECAQCHFGPTGSKVPAGSNWQHGTVPHNGVDLTVEEPVCLACHNLNRSFGNDPASCHDCHGEVLNHPLGQAWLDRTQEAYHGGSDLNCALCHELETKCSLCHFGPSGSKVPEGVVWQHGTIPHEEFGLTGPNAICIQCHELTRSYGTGPNNCHDCHTHAKGQQWLDKKQADFHGTSTLECGSCHNLNTECAQCHFGPTGSKVPAGSSWQHGAVPHNDADLTLQDPVCLACHNLNRSFGNDPASCHDCHTHAKGQQWLDKKQADFHGTSTLECGSCHNLNTECVQCHFGPAGSKVPAGTPWQHGNIPHNLAALTQQNGVCNQCHNVNRTFGNGPENCHDCHTHAKGQQWLDKKQADFHGTSSLECGSCHNLNTECAQCHFGPAGSKVPAGTAWQHADTPHNLAALTQQNSVCNQCHDVNRTFGNGPENCHDCHTHPTGQAWLDKNQAEFHGASNLNCADCHDLNGDCGACHFGPSGSKVPEGVAWQHGTIPHEEFGLTGPNAVCIQCHELNRSYGNDPVSCHDCHTHPKGQEWLDKNQSGFHGTSSLECASCHNLNTECVQCHFGSNGSKVPTGVVWNHGETPHDDPGLTSENETCGSCHDLNRSFGNDPTSCHDCHTHPAGQAWLDKNQAEFHGTSNLECGSCHNLNTECVQCHFGSNGSKVPTGVAWNHGETPHDDPGLTSENETCGSCHDLSRSFGNGPESCHDCHIHDLGQPWLDKNQAEFHGTSTLDCGSCHNLNTECVQCHFGSSGSRIPAGINWIHGSIPHDDQIIIDANDTCAACHDLNRSFGNDPASCHDCHTHPAGQPWLDKNQAEFHGASDLSCADCHDLGIKCSQCHFGPDGSKVPSGVTWTHGSVPHDQQGLIDEEAVCITCHDLNRSFGNDPAGCHDCHDNHPLAGADWVNKTTVDFHGGAAEADLSGCQACHGLDLSGGIGVSCFSCHTDNPMLVGDCVSCHSVPPDSPTQGGSRPNRDLAHSAHETIAIISGSCFVCHEGRGSGSADHYDTTAPASIDIQNGYAEFNQSLVIGVGSPITCDNLRCHGGQIVTWTDSIDLNSDCESCHTVGGSTFNRAKDKDDGGGLHKKHVDGENTACTVCHDTTKLNAQNRHFNDLDDTGVDEAGATITLIPDSGGGPGTYNQGAQTCTVTCHNEEHDNESWFD